MSSLSHASDTPSRNAAPGIRVTALLILGYAVLAIAQPQPAASSSSATPESDIAVPAHAQSYPASTSAALHDGESIADVRSRIKAIEDDRIGDAIARAEASADRMMGCAQFFIGVMAVVAAVLTILAAIALAFMAVDWWSIRQSARKAKRDAKQARKDAEQAKKDAEEAKTLAEQARKAADEVDSMAKEMRALQEKSERENRKTVERMQIIRAHTEAEAETNVEKKKALYEEVNAKYIEWLKKYPDEPDTAGIMFNRAVLLGQMKKEKEAIAAYDEVVSRFGNAAELELKDNVAMALVNKGNSLGEMKKLPEAIAAYEEVLSRFGNAAELELKVWVALAFAHLSVFEEEPRKKYALQEKAVELARQSIALGGNRYNCACVFALTERHDEAFDELTVCLEQEEVTWLHVAGDEAAGVAPDPDWDAVRDHPRYLELKQKYGS